ncbi:preprotein translocase subunit YajC [Inmirania thermothiophila]|uniref:Sec translocon accessory complex subunit YajC n=1 Tax=Inmirania thermothiophila TaxID=1750597 RepID=A0A3N1Y2R7_9GAMM|nr:preprotein translocase subunit YajC [Inmirania thermothiophila]ROR32808.1 protein translocase subunit yajC [Inmirania thermothiophila]
MNFLISDALAQEGAAPKADPLLGMLPLVILFVVFYFLLIRPQSKRAKEHRKMIEALAKGDEVVTNGGLAGRITALDDQFVTLQVADGVEVQVQRPMIAALLPKGTLRQGRGKGEKKGAKTES